MILLTFAIVQAGLFYFAQSIALGAATQGVSAGRGYQADAAAGQRRASNFLNSVGVGLDDPQVTVIRTATEIRVTVTGHAVSVLPGLTWTVTKTAHGPIERPTTP
ncbi:membrane protein [Dactylosporangium sucinum]|uniref:Membrane protein n=1 Tax=Dactylosporangium sucinum TaxID=1424081 RepID=A0A917TK26_9ACTN|nr:membrane protein [Dactylosporangium sucinum]